jgi:hypothetical protein
MKNIHLLPKSEQKYQVKEGGLFINDTRKHSWGKLEVLKCERITVNGHAWNGTGIRTDICHLYITSDEEIKVNDYITDGYRAWKWKDDSSLLGRKKIILTTDQDLIKDGVQAIDDEFLEWFVKNPSCEFVEINKEYLSNTGEWKEVLLPSEWEVDTKFRYKIIIPQEEPKQAYYEEQKELRRKLLNLIDNLEKDELLRLSKEEANQETLENKLELLISEWNKRQLQYTDLASQNIDCSHTTKKFTYKAMATRDCWKELLTLLNNHKDEQTRNT